jgi:hypothetical protein
MGGRVQTVPDSPRPVQSVCTGEELCDFTDVSVVTQIWSRRPAFSAAGSSRLPPPVPFAGVPRRSCPWSFHPGSRVFQAAPSSRLGSISPTCRQRPVPPLPRELGGVTRQVLIKQECTFAVVRAALATPPIVSGWMCASPSVPALAGDHRTRDLADTAIVTLLSLE